MWHGEKKNLHRPTFQHGTEFSSQNETSTTVTSQGRSEVKQQNELCTDEIRSHDNSKKKKKKKIFILHTFSVTTDWKPTRHVFILFSWRHFCRVDLKFDFPFVSS